MNKWKQIACLLLAGIFFLGCGKSSSKRISIGLVDGWAEGTAMTNVAQAYLAEKGYHVVMQKATVNMLLASMDNGDTDVYMDVWLPTTHGEKVKPFPNLENVGVNYNEARSGLVVPEYVDINSIEELNAHADKFNHRIVGIERGSGIVTHTDDAIEAYKLDFEQLNSSTVAMAAELSQAIEQKQWIVVTGWQPHWLFGRYKLKFLDDPKNVYGEAEHLDTYVRQGFAQDFPEVYHFLQNVTFDSETMAKLLTKMESGRNKEKIAKEWINENRALLDTWWPENSPQNSN